MIMVLHDLVLHTMYEYSILNIRLCVIFHVFTRRNLFVCSIYILLIETIVEVCDSHFIHFRGKCLGVVFDLLSANFLLPRISTLEYRILLYSAAALSSQAFICLVSLV